RAAVTDGEQQQRRGREDAVLQRAAQRRREAQTRSLGVGARRQRLAHAAAQTGAPRQGEDARDRLLGGTRGEPGARFPPEALPAVDRGGPLRLRRRRGEGDDLAATPGESRVPEPVQPLRLRLLEWALRSGPEPSRPLDARLRTVRVLAAQEARRAREVERALERRVTPLLPVERGRGGQERAAPQELAAAVLE